MKNLLKLIVMALSLAMMSVHATEAVQNTSNGVIGVNIHWDTNDMGGDALYSKIKFLPNEKVGSCERLSFIQIARVRTEGQKNLDWSVFSGQSNRNFIRTKSLKNIEDGYFIDHDATLCTKGKSCSPFYRDSWENNDDSSDGESTADIKKEASMVDAPYGWESFESIELEACAVCQNDNSLKVLACAKWGGSWPASGDRVILPIKFSDHESETFQDALKRFFNFYKS